jgi:hypothetical protein
MNQDRQLVIFDGFSPAMQLTSVIEAVHVLTGLKAAHRDPSEILAVFPAPTTDPRFKSYFVLFKYIAIFDLIKQNSSIIDNQMCIGNDGEKIRVKLPGTEYYYSKIEQVPSDTFVMKLRKQYSMNLWQLAEHVEKLMDAYKIMSTSSVAVESLVHLLNGDMTIVTKSRELFMACQDNLNKNGVAWRQVKICAIPKKVDTNDTTTLPVATVSKAKKRKVEKTATSPMPSTNVNGMKKLKITEETRQLLALISSGRYDIYIKERNEENFSSLFE